jgi:NAD(P)-dependent dehydrogenase (short-subunit alcohol dehydrogenase family)
MPRPLQEQVVVITGASSGIGRETARQLVARGAKVVLAARNDIAMHVATQTMPQAAERTLIVPTDVSVWPEVERLAAAAVERFGRIDTWVNDAALFYDGPVETMTVEDMNRVIQVNLMGQMHGVKAVLPYMMREGQGVIINVSSVEGVRGIPLQAAYAASKHGVKGFTEAFRLELARDHPDIHITLVLPASINTPFFDHGRSALGVKPRPIPPVYEPRAVAEAIVFAAEHPRRDIYIGPGRGVAAMQGLAPALVDWLMMRRSLIFKVQRSDQPDDGRDNFSAHMPADTYSIQGAWDNMSMGTSLVTNQFELHPWRRHVAVAVAAIGAMMLTRRLSR